MNDTPPVTTTVPPKEPDSLHASLLKSLQLTVTPSAPALNADGSPAPDTGVEVTSTIDDFSDRSGSLADKIAKINKDIAAATPTAPTPDPVAPTTATPAEPPKPAATVPPVDPTKVDPPAAPRITVPELPKPFKDDVVIPPPPSQLDLSGLDDDEVEEVLNAQFAERQYPSKYSGHAQKVLTFLKKHKQFVSQHKDADENNDEYKEFLVANRPTISASERKRIERERLLDEAASMAERRMSAKTKRLEDEVTQLKATPIVEKTINDYRSLVKDVMPKDDDPIVVEAVNSMSTKAVDAGKEFMLLSANLKPYDSKNDTHRWLADFIQEQADLYSSSKHPSLKRGSKTFLPRAQFNRLSAEERSKHFTFTDEDVLQLIAVNAKAAAEYHSNQERERLKKAGYTRAPAPSAAPVSATPVAPPAPDPSVRATPTVSGGGPITTAPEADPMKNWLFNRK